MQSPCCRADILGGPGRSKSRRFARRRHALHRADRATGTEHWRQTTTTSCCPRSANSCVWKPPAASLLMAAALLALIASNTRRGFALRSLPDVAGRDPDRRAGDRQAAAAVDQRRADGGVLPAGRAGDQARAAAKASFRASAQALLPAVGRHRRHGGAGGDLSRDHRRRPRRRRRAGRSRRRPTSPSRSACCRCWASACRRASRCSCWRSRSSTISAPSSIIAIFYTGELSTGSLWRSAAAASLAAMFALNRLGVTPDRALCCCSASCSGSAC